MIRANPDTIIETLKEQYGDSDEVLLELFDNVFATQSLVGRPKHEILELAIKVKALVTHAKAYGKTNQLKSYYICGRVVDKLRSEHQDMWGNILRENPRAGVEELSALFFCIARMPSCKKPRMKHKSDSEPRTNDFTKCDDNNKRCPHCKGKHLLERCAAFINASLPQRYNFINRNLICSACLKSSEHVWQNCPNKIICNIGGCTNHHHKLLHRFVDKDSCSA